MGRFHRNGLCSNLQKKQGGHMSAPSQELIREFAPTGPLRAAINIGNIVLAQGTPDAPRGVTVDLARELAKRLGLELQFVPFDAAGKVVDALKEKRWDVAFLAIEPVRAAEIAFTAPYVIIEGVYVVPAGSPIKTMEEVDREGVRIAVNIGAAYDLYLSRTLKKAELVRAPDSFVSFVDQKLDVLAGVKQPLAAFVKAHPGTRMLDGRFQEIRQAMGVPQGRPRAADYIKGFVEEMKASGFVADALKRSNQPDATVAPPA
jgi:polar amino acid transport system substrate-binding protein